MAYESAGRVWTRVVTLLCLVGAAACSGAASERDAEAARDAGGQVAQSAAAPETATFAHAPAAAPAALGAHAVDTSTLTVYKTPTCGCCNAWVDHMREHGFLVVAIDTADVTPIKDRLGVRPDHASCHTATVGGYVLEGHVPAADVRRLLAERPAVTGLAVPGMPMGSPGMEGPTRDAYDVVAFTRGGAAHVYASH